MYDILELNKKLLAELRDIAKELKIKRVESFKKQDLIYKILDTQAIVVSENKAAKKEAPRKEASRREGPRKEQARKEQKAAVTEESPAQPRKRPGRPKKRKKTGACSKCGSH
jgi:transcription termination factor Rho